MKRKLTVIEFIKKLKSVFQRLDQIKLIVKKETLNEGFEGFYMLETKHILE